MSGINKTISVGRLIKDPEMHTFEDGGAVTSFTLYTSREWVDKETKEKKEYVTFIPVKVKNRQAKACSEYLQKGSEVYVEGEFTTDEWEKDGTKQYKTYVKANNVLFLGSKPQEDTTPF